MQRLDVGAFQVKRTNAGFLGGPVVKNPPASAGDTSSTPALGKSKGSYAQAPQLPSLHALEPVLRNERSHCNEKPSTATRE